MKVVIDTNVLVAAFLTSGTSRETVDEILSARVGVLSEYILNEFKRVLLSRKFEFPEKVVSLFIHHLKQFVKFEDENECSGISFPDNDDRKILALCRSVQADFLVTGDKELLALKKFGSTRIVGPTEFLRAT